MASSCRMFREEPLARCRIKVTAPRRMRRGRWPSGIMREVSTRARFRCPGKIQESFTRLCRPRSYEGITGKIRLHLGQRLLSRRRAHVKISKRLSSFARYPDHLQVQPYAVRAIGAIHREGLFGTIHDHMEGQIFAFHDALYSRLPCSQASSTFTISPISQSRPVTLSAIAGIVHTV
jgi:hypothetical protein